MTQRIYLIPGFFGFANVGELKYFDHVRRKLDDALRQRDLDAFVHYVPTLPTASIRSRTERLLEVIAGTAIPGRDTIHLLGHSTGGLDARLLTSPGIELSGDHIAEGYARQVKTVLCVSTPHYGTPLAAFFNGMIGQQLLKLLSALTLHTIRLGSAPLPAFVALADALPGSRLIIKGNILDQIFRDLLRDFDASRRRDLIDFFEQVTEEQSLITQLTPDAMDLFSASAADRPGVRYGSIISCAPRPSMLNQLKIGLKPTDQAMFTLYRTLHSLTSNGNIKRPELTQRQRMALLKAFGHIPDMNFNDSVVPTISQVYGEVVHVAWADHHDTIGHFNGPGFSPPHIDWLKTQSNFRRHQFDRLWDKALDFMFPKENNTT